MPTAIQRLFKRVSRRQWWRQFGLRLHWYVLAFAGSYLILLLISRLSGLWPEGFALWSVLIVPAAAIVAAFFATRRTEDWQAAQLVDQATQSKELFLTAVMLDRSAGGYQPLVVRQAEQKAAGVSAADIVPLRGLSRLWQPASALAVLVLATLLVPQLDPFDRQEQQRLLAQQREELEKHKQATEERASVLKNEPLDAAMSEEIAQALEQLQQSFNRMKPDAQQQNFSTLNQHQRRLGNEWRKAGQKQLEAASRSQQQFGQAQQGKFQQWKKELAAGNASGVRKEARELRELAERMAEAKNSGDRQAIQQELQKRLRDLADFAKSNGLSNELNNALNRALNQMQMANTEGLEGEALEALSQSLELSELEMEALAQSMRDVQAMEEALKAIQMAKQLNQLEALDGEAGAECEGIGEYTSLYQSMLAGRGGNGIGPGMNGAGTGKGNLASEDDNEQTNFTPEKSRSAITAGRILMQMKSQEPADPGEARQAYQQQVQQVKQSVSESILQERVPPGYHDAIRKYFDAVPQQESSP